jgi:hypothetical protein
MAKIAGLLSETRRNLSKFRLILSINSKNMKSAISLILLIIIFSITAAGQSTKTKNVIIVTMDGMRWEEIFGGIDFDLLNNKRYTHDSADMAAKYWDENSVIRRQKLFPFLWTTVASHGQLYGDRNNSSQVNNANPYWFSYPGYNEIFTGYPDTAVNSNDKNRNQNKNVLEFINAQPEYKGRVAAFSTWDVIPYILNKWRSGVYVNSDSDALPDKIDQSALINDIQKLSAKPHGERLDILTYISAREYLKAYKPRVLYISFDETDEYAHAGQYDQYVGSAHAEDGMLADIWTTIQSMPEYRDQTTLLVTCDHGRGNAIKDQWRDHGQKVKDAGQIWIAAMGPDTKAMGEVKTNEPLYQKQIAPTIAAFLGLHFVPDHETTTAISTILK